MKRGLVRAAAVAASIAAVGAVVTLAMRASAPPSRCGPGFVARETRCCAPGQIEDRGRCVGRVVSCAPPLVLVDGACAARREAIRIGGGSVRIGPSDWEAQGVVAPRTVVVGPFALDRFEVDVSRYRACVRSGKCPDRRLDGDGTRAAALSFEAAEALCAAEGGRLPTDDEWTFAAMGPTARRYPWGDTGAVCARAAFGLVSGQCATGATGPDTVGAHPSGRSPEGVDDLAGNVAEWTVASDGNHLARGGSYASRLATDLRGWRTEASPTPDEVGARCAYDVERSTAPPVP